MNDRLLRALAGRNYDRPPVWLMRQAGRYLPEYRALRANRSFMEMVQTPDLIAEVTQQPLRRFDLDAAIIFSDILLVADVLGCKLRFEEGKGPILENRVRTLQDVQNLPEVDVTASFDAVAKGIAQLVPQLKVPLIGFCGGAFTVASYMVEGGSNRELATTKLWMRCDPQAFHRLLEVITDVSIAYLRLQVQAGVSVLQIFDTWASALSYAHFGEYVLPYLDRMIRGVADLHVPVILYCRGSSLFAKELAQLLPAAISLDWNGSLPAIRRAVGTGVALQGNLDPYALFATKEVVRKEVGSLLTSMQGDPGYIFNLGHGILPGTPIESVQSLVDCVTRRSQDSAVHSCKGSDCIQEPGEFLVPSSDSRILNPNSSPS